MRLSTSTVRKPAIMIQGTNSDAGKSLIVAGLCRLFANRGMRVRPFKPQNMSNNAAVSEDDEPGELGRAQALQARAARVPASVHMNPVLLKPESDSGSQVIVQGRRRGRLRAAEFARARPELLEAVLDSFHRLEAEADLLVVEGAGSPAEVNLRAGDIANMGFAEAADLPVLLAGDIDRGGVIATLVGTAALLGTADRSRIRGFLINKFRGDALLFEPANAIITERTGWRALGILPWFDNAHRLPAEDALGLASARREGAPLSIAVPRLNRIANFDDLDPLRLEPDVDLAIIRPGEPLPGDADLVLIAGSKSTIADLADFRRQGWDIDLLAHCRRGGHVLGLCGGFQMLGRTIRDPDGIEGPTGEVEGLGLLDIETILVADKTVRRSRGRHVASGLPVEGYEIHLGRSTGPDCARPFLEIDGRGDGAVSGDGRVTGTYLHGMFTDDRFRRHFLDHLRPGLTTATLLPFDQVIERTLDELAGHLEVHLDIEEILRIAQDRR